MFGRIRQFEICCDAPPYGIVRACERCGFQSPLDVRWWRLSRFLAGEGPGNSNLVIGLWQWLGGWRKRKPTTCTCGRPLPDLKKYSFTFFTMKVGDFFLGQCRQCRTVFWDDALPLPAWMEDGVAGLTASVEM
jgi:hypothetical protein